MAIKISGMAFHGFSEVPFSHCSWFNPVIVINDGYCLFDSGVIITGTFIVGFFKPYQHVVPFGQAVSCERLESYGIKNMSYEKTYIGSQLITKCWRSMRQGSTKAGIEKCFRWPADLEKIELLVQKRIQGRALTNNGKKEVLWARLN